MEQCVPTILYVCGMYVGCTHVVVIMLQDHRYLEAPILGVQRRFRVKSQHPNSHPPHISRNVQNYALSPTTSSQ